MLLEKKRILVTGVLNDASMAFAAARVAQEQGAEVVLSSFGRVMRITERTARRLTTPDVQIVELDVQNADDLDTLAERVGGPLHGVVHSIGFAPASCLGGGFLDAPWEDVAIAMQTSRSCGDARGTSCSTRAVTRSARCEVLSSRSPTTISTTSSCRASRCTPTSRGPRTSPRP